MSMTKRPVYSIMRRDRQEIFAMRVVEKKIYGWSRGEMARKEQEDTFFAELKKFFFSLNFATQKLNLKILNSNPQIL